MLLNEKLHSWYFCIVHFTSPFCIYPHATRIHSNHYIGTKYHKQLTRVHKVSERGSITPAQLSGIYVEIEIESFFFQKSYPILSYPKAFRNVKYFCKSKCIPHAMSSGKDYFRTDIMQQDNIHESMVRWDCHDKHS